ncbi:hypothetical protein OG285_14715 [Streptomyces sp. NBC_01471]|uniref:hypothetical protein n=1 Tax=Streptomyces sp. NBC_01471 TaxID=2903879 RepID=UPI003247A105
MVEGEKGSRQANGSSGGAPRQRRPAAPDAGGGTGQPPGDLAQLLATVGALLEGHAADDLVVMVREELERREFTAYGRGWRDAAAQYHQLAEWVGFVQAGETGDRVPGQAAVIPFRRRERYDRPDYPQLRPRAGGSVPADPYRDTYGDHAGTRRDDHVPEARTTPTAMDQPRQDQPRQDQARPDQLRPDQARPDQLGPDQARPDHPRPDAPRPEPQRAGVHRTPSPPADPVEAGPAVPLGTVRATPPDPRPPRGSRFRPPVPDTAVTPPPRPAFAPKNRRSKVPTIPRLSRPRRRDLPDAEG